VFGSSLNHRVAEMVRGITSEGVSSERIGSG
jgi:hypothetical protein